MYGPKLLLCWLVISHATMFGTFAQHHANVSFVIKNKPVKELPDLLAPKTGYSISGDIFTEDLRISVKVNNLHPLDAVKACIARLPYSIEKAGKNISIVYLGGPLFRKITGHVCNDLKQPLSGATVTAIPGYKTATTDAKGNFTLSIQVNADSLKCSYVNTTPSTLVITAADTLFITLNVRSSELDKVEVNSNKNIRPVRNFAVVSSEQVDLSHRDNVVIPDTYQLLKNFGGSLLVEDERLFLRGVSGIYSDQQPLIVLNGFVFTGSLKSINTADIESITFLKDAMAAAIWGPRSSNGVICIQTKSGKFNTPLTISMTSTASFRKCPSAYRSQPILASSELIDFQKSLFKNGFYDVSLLNRSSYPDIPPVAEILDKERRHELSGSEASRLLDSLRQYDVRDDLNKYYFQDSYTQQYALNGQYGDSSFHMFFSLGINRQRPVLKGNYAENFTATFNHTQKLAKYKAEISTSILLSRQKDQLNNAGVPPGLLTYQPLADKYGNPLAVTRDHRDGYTDTAGANKLGDWKYRPLQDLYLARNTHELNSVVATINLRKPITSALHLLAAAQLQSSTLIQDDRKDSNSYYTRNLVNRFSTIDPNGNVHIQVPGGIIRDENTGKTRSYTISMQLQFADTLNRGGKSGNFLSATGGIDLNRITEVYTSTRTYNYRPNYPPSFVNTLQALPLYFPDQSDNIPTAPVNENGINNNFLSFYLNGNFLLGKKWSFSGTVRKDLSNLFGDEANKHGSPLWVLGAAWSISKSRFYPFKKIIPYFNISLTQGITGNTSKSMSPLTTAQYAGINSYGQSVAVILNPPNASLRLERTSITNIGIKMATPGDWLQLKFEYYYKSSWDLLSTSPVDYTAGVSQYFGNTANMEGRGYDLNILTRLGYKDLRSISNLVFSHATNRISRYLVSPGTVGSYLREGQINPIVGRPLYPVYGLPTAGPDPRTGQLQALVDGHPSLNYSEVLSSTDLNKRLLYYGSAIPTYYGNLYQEISWKGISVAASVRYKFGYFIRATSINYSQLAMYNLGHKDYAIRWQKPGDELATQVPSFIYPFNTLMDYYDQYADTHIERGDHIRLQNVRVAYQVPPVILKKGNEININLFFSIDELGIIWRKNKKDIDPDYPAGNPPGKTLGGGIKLTFKFQ
jgi:TonB-dependent SusC/RagA subfamily outer membrane receptor